MKRFLSAVSLAVLAGLAVAAPSRAADLETTPPASPMSPQAVQGSINGWTFAISPYFWAAGMSGDVKQFGLPEVHVNASFSDIFKNLDFAAMAIGEARYGRFSVFGDAMYVKLSGEAATPRGIVANKVSLDTSTFAGLLGAGYSIYQDGNTYIDIAAGGRVWNVDSELNFRGGFLGGRSGSDSATWADAMVGTRFRYAFTDNWYLTGWGMIGGGGASVDWDVAAGIGYKFTDMISAVAGYRALGVRYNHDDFVFDVVQQGPIVGLVFRF
jgi:hypothetical protein